MKLLHTSDWHLGHRLYNYDRSDEEDRFFVQLADVVHRERPDAMVVCGDVFHTGAPGNDVARRFTDGLLAVQSECPEMMTVVIAGNHDSYSRLVVDKALWSRCRVHVFGVPAENAMGLADFSGNVVSVPGRGVIAAVPFCCPRNFPPAAGGSADGMDRGRTYFEGLAQHVRSVSNGLPAVLAAHLAVSGELDFRGHDRTSAVGGEECVDMEELGSVYDYVALGHIHCPQWIRGGRKARYCGTPRAVHFDEMHRHGVDIVTVEAGKRPEVRTEIFEPLHALVTIGGESGKPFDEALGLVAGANLPGDTYVRLNVRLAAGELPGPNWSELARQACLARGLRFCVNNPVREGSPERLNDAGTLTVGELRELSDDMVLDILSGLHELTGRHRELIKSLMEEARR